MSPVYVPPAHHHRARSISLSLAHCDCPRSAAHPIGIRPDRWHGRVVANLYASMVPRSSNSCRCAPTPGMHGRTSSTQSLGDLGRLNVRPKEKTPAPSGGQILLQSAVSMKRHCLRVGSPTCDQHREARCGVSQRGKRHHGCLGAGARWHAPAQRPGSGSGRCLWPQRNGPLF